MNIILIIICLVVFLWALNYKKKIDKEEEIALKTPGRAIRLREHYGEVIELVLKSEDHQILSERSYDESIRIGNSKNQELFMSYSPLGSHGSELHVVCLQDSMVIKEWKFDNRRTNVSIYQKIADYFY